MMAALLGALFGTTSRRWLSIDAGRGETFKPSGTHVHVIVGIGNRIIYNAVPSTPPLSESPQESSHAEGA
jgi:hypothetical protein